MRIHNIIVLPDFGFFGDNFITGHCHGNTSQQEAIEHYAKPMIDALENDYIYHTPITTWRGPSLSQEQREGLGSHQYELVLALGCGWHKNPRTKNGSRVLYSRNEDLHVAQMFCESLADWGHRYVFGHQVSRPVKLDTKQRIIRIEPFSLNGPNSAEYQCRLKELGETVALSLSMYLNERRYGRIKYG